VWTFEQIARQKGYSIIAGIDEAGRGPLAGPVVAAAVILGEDFSVNEIKDSKQLSSSKRSRLHDDIHLHAYEIGVGMVSHEKIDEINILQAARLSMLNAVTQLKTSPEYLLIDGINPIETELPQETIKKGDQRSISIAAASIIAKVERDRIMSKYALDYPEYGFDQHKGYPTRQHREAIKKYGICPIHRKTFKGCN